MPPHSDRLAPPLVRPRAVGLVLIGIAVGLTCLGLAERYYRIVLDGDALQAVRLNPSAEAAIPAWYSSGMLLVAGLVLLAIAQAARRDGLPHAKRWGALSLIFLYLSVDEATAIHEAMSRAVGRALDGAQGPFSQPWVIVAVLLLPVVVLALWPLLSGLPRRTARTFAVAAAVYLLGAVVVETAGGWLGEPARAAMAGAGVAALEELLEMVGAALFVSGSLAHLGATTGGISIGRGARTVVA